MITAEVPIANEELIVWLSLTLAAWISYFYFHRIAKRTRDPTVNESPSGIGKFFASWNNDEVDEEYGKYSRYNALEAKRLLDKHGYKLET